MRTGCGPAPRSAVDRPIGVRDATVLAALHAAAFAAPPENDDSATPWAQAWPTRAIATLLALPAVFGFLRFDAEGRPAGFVLAQVAATEAEILTLAVVPNQRGKGHGAALLAAAIAAARSRGAQSMFLEVAEANRPAFHLYQSAGFEPVGIRRNYYTAGGKTADATILRLNL